MSPHLQTRFAHTLTRLRQVKQQGFTLLELLVAILIGSIITSGLLFVVLELLSVNSREESLTLAQTSMKRAMDYMTRDVGEAVFVYSNLTDLMTQLDDEPTGNPVLAFWRLDPLTDAQVTALQTFCSGKTGTVKQECDVLLIRQAYYTLVVYFHQTNTAGDIWEGPARLIRYELPKYSNVSNLTQTAGYADPTLLVPGTQVVNSFDNWQASTTATNGNAVTLTDYVGNDTATAVACQTGFARIPAAGNSVYACVSGGTAQDINKSLIVYLQGDADKSGTGRTVGVSEESSLPRLESQVLIRGVLQNTPL